MNIEIKVQRLERQMVWLKRGLGVCMLVALLPWLAGQTAVPDEETNKRLLEEYHKFLKEKKQGFVVAEAVAAEVFFLIDKGGKQRGSWFMDDGVVFFQLSPGKSGFRVRLKASEQGAILGVQDAYGNMRVAFGELKGSAFVEIRDAAGKIHFQAP